jgi:hypothetical protein
MKMKDISVEKLKDALSIDIQKKMMEDLIDRIDNAIDSILENIEEDKEALFEDFVYSFCDQHNILFETWEDIDQKVIDNVKIDDGYIVELIVDDLWDSVF